MSSAFDADSLLHALGRVGRPRVAVVGDLILDRYVVGDVARISPEAPIPVLAARSEELRLGGAGNVAANLAAMGADVAMVALVGDDGRGRALRELLEELSIDASGVAIDPERPTIEKTRLLSGVQQMLRVDREDDEWAEKDQRDRRWMTAAEAASAVAEPELATLVSEFGSSAMRE